MHTLRMKQEFEAVRGEQISDESDSVLTSTQLLNFFCNGELRFCELSDVLQDVDTSVSTVVGTKEYAFPSNAMKLLRVTYDGEKIYFVTVATLDNWDRNWEAQSNGTPTNYYIRRYEDEWKIGLYVPPDDALVLGVTYTRKPDTMGSIADSVTPEIPEEYHMALVYYALAQSYARDQEFDRGRRFYLKFRELAERARVSYMRDENDKVVIYGGDALDEVEIIGEPSYVGNPRASYFD